MKRLVVEIDLIMYDVILHVSRLIIVVIVRVVVLQVMRQKLTVTAHLPRNDQMSLIETIWKYSWNLSQTKKEH